MSKFDELAALAAKTSEGFIALKEEVTTFAGNLIQGLRAYLGCTTKKQIICEVVDRNHNRTGDRSILPSPCFCFDAFWYFFMDIMFPTYHIGVLVGIKKVEGGYTVRLPSKEYQIDNESQRTAFYEDHFNNLKKYLSQPR